MYAFDIERPTTLAEAVKLLAASDENQALGGGQTLIPTLKQRLAMPEVLVSLTAIDEIKGICEDDEGRLCIGAATTHAEVAAGAGKYPCRTGREPRRSGGAQPGHHRRQPCQ